VSNQSVDSGERTKNHPIKTFVLLYTYSSVIPTMFIFTTWREVPISMMWSYNQSWKTLSKFLLLHLNRKLGRWFWKCSCENGFCVMYSMLISWKQQVLKLWNHIFLWALNFVFS